MDILLSLDIVGRALDLPEAMCLTLSEKWMGVGIWSGGEEGREVGIWIGYV